MASKLYQKAVNAFIDRYDPMHKKSRRLYQGEYHVPLHNFTGPGTRLDLEDVRNFPPYNDIDACSKQHDIDYEDIKKHTNWSKEEKAEAIHLADKKAIDCYDKYPTEYGYKAARAGIKGKLGLESLYSLLRGKPSTFYGGGITYKLDGFNRQMASIDTIDKVLARKRLPETESIGIRNAIKAISYDRDNISPFGSWIYKSQLYPGDIDLIETEILSGTKTKAIRSFVKITQKIVKKIMKMDGYYIGDIKAGFDRRYMIDIGRIIYGQNSKIVGFDIEKIANQLRNLKEKDLLTKDEIEKIKLLLNAIISNNAGNDGEEATTIEGTSVPYWEELNELLRDKWLLRWSPEEILKGYKHLKGPSKILLSNAIQDHTLTKIDMWTDKGMNGRFIELSNVLSYIWIKKDKTGKAISREVINFENNIENFAENLKSEVAKYAFSKTYYKPTKMLKRMWSIARLNIISNKEASNRGQSMLVPYYDDIKTLTPILQSDVGRLSQIISDLDVIKLISAPEEDNHISSHDYSAIIPDITNELSNIIYRMQNLYQIDEEKIDEATEGIEYTLDNCGEKEVPRSAFACRNFIYENIGEIKKFLNNVLQEYAKSLLEKIGLYPPPSRYLPSTSTSSGSPMSAST